MIHRRNAFTAALVPAAIALGFAATSLAQQPDRDRPARGPAAQHQERAERAAEPRTVRPIARAARQDAVETVLEVLRDRSAPAEVRGTPNQIEVIRALRLEHLNARRDFLLEHRDQLRELREQAMTARRDADTPEEARRAAAEARARMREVMNEGPQQQELLRKVFEELTDAQRQAVRQRLAQHRAPEGARPDGRRVVRPEGARPAERQRRRADAPPVQHPRWRAERSGPERERDARLERLRGQRGDEAEDRGTVQQRRQRFIRLFEGLSEQEQEALLQRLEQRSRDRHRQGSR